MTADGPTLLTGATGFVGSAVARVLAARGHRLRLLVRPTSDRRNLAGVDAELALGDLTDAASLTRAASGCRYVFNVAADYRFWVPDPDAMLRANVDGTRGGDARRTGGGRRADRPLQFGRGARARPRTARRRTKPPR